ncbi:MAG: DUF1653 domain-containing protein [Lachnospiraceae bacterium]|nr:DUF1653 domain-containing protein [Lachnospiraceae bacterium]
MTNIPIPQQIYRHFKGNLYQIVSLAEHTETGEKLVIYQALYGEFKVYARPLSQFLEKVDHTKYPDVLQKYRFEQVTVTDDEEGQDEQDCADSIENDPQMEETSETNLEAACQDIQQDNAGTEETLNIDPLVLDFLDAKSYEDRLNILASLHHRITDDMINIMAMSMDVEVKEGDIEDRYTELRKCLLLYDKFECTRLR